MRRGSCAYFGGGPKLECYGTAHAIASWQTIDIATQLLKIEDQCECLVKLIESMESAKYTIKEAV